MGEILRKLGIMLMVAAVLALGSGTALATGWTFTDLSAMGAIDPTQDNGAGKINENGDIVGGAYFVGEDYKHSTLWSDGVVYDLGSLGARSGATSINDAGVIVGGAYIAPNTAIRHATMYSPGAAPVDIHPDIPSVRLSESGIADINNSGQMVGAGFSDLYLDQVPIRWSDPNTYELLDAGELGIGHANRINNLGQVTGAVAVVRYTPDGVWQYGSHAAFWDTDGTLTILGDFDGRFSWTHNLNDLGQVLVDVSNGSATERWSYVWQNGEIGERLPGLGGGLTEANAINNSGLIVGQATTADGSRHAVLWQDGEIIDLNDYVSDPDLVLYSANDINEKGQIVGWGIRDDGTRNGVHFAFALSPNLTPTPVPTPIPPAVFLFGSGLAGLGVFRRRFFRA